MLKVSSINKAIIAVALVEVAVDVRIALRLPGTYLDTRQVWVVKVNHQEEITGISVVRGVVVLMNLNTISVLANPHFLHVVIGKADVDELVALETTFYVADIFLLAVARVFHHLVVEVSFVFCCLLGFFDHMPHNDDGIVIEDALDIVGTLQGEGCLIILKEGGNDHADAIVPATGLTVEDVNTGGFVETKGDRLYELVGGQPCRDQRR